VGSQRMSIGLDVHARSVVGCAIDEDTGEISRRRFGYQMAEVLDWVKRFPQPSLVTYEAGPTGFGLARLFATAGIECVVAAPSKLQRPSGDRVKTDERDALHLARLLRLGEIVAVRVPSIEQETCRDLVRSREDNRGDLMAARHRLSKLLLRHGIVYDGKQAWTGAHDRWLRQQRFEHPGLRAAFDADYEAVEQILARKARLDTAIEKMAAESEYAPIVTRLGCLRGVSTLTGFGLAVEIGDWHRFSGATIGAFVGLVPSEHSSGQSRSQGSITKTGNGHARRLLVEAAWHHRVAYRPGETMKSRWAVAPAAAAARGHEGNQRLHRRWQQMVARKKRSTIANVAISRELAGWCWSLAIMDD
jgi:transposase